MDDLAQVSVLHLSVHGEFIESDGVDLQPLLNRYHILLVALDYNIAGLLRMGLESLIINESDVKYKSYKYKSFVIMSNIITFIN